MDLGSGYDIFFDTPTYAYVSLLLLQPPETTHHVTVTTFSYINIAIGNHPKPPHPPTAPARDTFGRRRRGLRADGDGCATVGSLRRRVRP